LRRAFAFGMTLGMSKLFESEKIWDASAVIGPHCQKPRYSTSLGHLFDGDCLKILPFIKNETVDTIFADPPFNIGKKYGKSVNDDRPDGEYIQWCKSWIDECIRVLKPGGAFFLYNLPKWNIMLGGHMGERLTFRHWVAVSIKLCLPIPKRLYPAHYSLLYYTKGTPKTFRNIRTPIQVCRHCGKEIKDYGGHRGAMNPLGVNLTDVWEDIPPVRHWKFKSKRRTANQLSTKLIRRCVEISTVEGDLVLDPFGGSGTTFDVCEHIKRHWLGMEIENADVIMERLENGELHHHETDDFVDVGHRNGNLRSSKKS
jgi:site-specific DNA-methyltransferase (adenine-specific)